MTWRCNIFRPRLLAEVICNNITCLRKVTDDVVRAAAMDGARAAITVSVVSDNAVCTHCCLWHVRAVPEDPPTLAQPAAYAEALIRRRFHVNRSFGLPHPCCRRPEWCTKHLARYDVTVLVSP